MNNELENKQYVMQLGYSEYRNFDCGYQHEYKGTLIVVR
jgi:hypothetical protein